MLGELRICGLVLIIPKWYC